MSKAYYYRAGDDSLDGPYTSMDVMRAKILEQAKDQFNGACNCLKGGDLTNWFEHVQIFELVMTLRPFVKARFKLEEVQP